MMDLNLTLLCLLCLPISHLLLALDGLKHASPKEELQHVEEQESQPAHQRHLHVVSRSWIARRLIGLGEVGCLESSEIDTRGVQ